MTDVTSGLLINTTATEKLTPTYLQKLSRQKNNAFIATILIIAGNLVWTLFGTNHNSLPPLIFILLFPVASLFAGGWALITAYRARYGTFRLGIRYQLAWLLVGWGIIFNGVAGIFTSLTFIHSSSLAEIGFTLFYPCTLAGLILFIFGSNQKNQKLRIILDSVITILCLIGINYFFLFRVTSLDQLYLSTSHIDFFLALSYILWDILLVVMIVLFIQHHLQILLESSLFLLGFGILIFIASDISSLYFSTRNTTFLDFIDTNPPFCYTGTLFIGLSSFFQYAKLAQLAYYKRPQVKPQPAFLRYLSRNTPEMKIHFVILQSILIYPPFIILLITTLYSEYQETSNSSFILIILCATVGTLIIIRYLLAFFENNKIIQQREKEHKAAELLRNLSTQLTAQLEFEPLLGQIIQLAVSEIGFEVCVLFLIQDYDYPLNAQSNFVLRTAEVGSTTTNTCRFQGLQFASSILLLGKEIEVSNDGKNQLIPPEVYEVIKEHNILAIWFIPIIYQGKILGSLGVANRTTRYFDPELIQLARTYAEQIATNIEHAHLYQIAREHETFAKALANIATRLNVAITDPVEIHQLICTEGANALQADMALLYAPNSKGQLKPLAVYNNKPGVSPLVSEWPVLQQNDFEAQVLSSLQPILLQASQLYADKNQRVSKLAISSAIQIPSLSEKFQQYSVHTVIFSPLLAWGEPVALLILARSFCPGIQQKNAFTNMDLSHVQDFSEQASVAFTNAHLYQQQHAANKRLQELDQLKDQFMITASHELRTPLTAVQGYLELMNQYGDFIPKEQQRDFLQKAQRSCDELVVLLTNVMDASRLEVEAGIRPGHLGRVLLQEVLNSVLNMIEPQITQDRRTVHQHIPADTAVLADHGRLQQVLLNLSANAIKYSPTGTPILFEARQDEHQNIIISVIDKGNGIAPEDQNRLFQRFVRLERDINSPIRGSGLGLYISQRLIQAMHGQIWVESSGIPGEGSTFNVQLPAAQ